jgi:hypothetical protein
MQLTFLGKETTGGQSPTLYATDRGTYVVQGWIVTDPYVLVRLTVSDDETVVEVPARLMAHLTKDGLAGGVVNHEPPIVLVKENGNLIIQGIRVTDPDALAEMDVPDHETCVEVSKVRMKVLVEGR